MHGRDERSEGFEVGNYSLVIPAKAGIRPSRIILTPAQMKEPCVYLMASKAYGTLYTGLTSDLHGRMAQHDQALFDGFTKKYAIKTLVYYEAHATMEDAIAREKRLKRWRREWKYRMIEQMNPEWRNLYDPATVEILFGPADVERLLEEPEHGCDLAGSPPTRG